MLNIDTAKSFATEENLEQALTKANIKDKHHVVVRNRAGRWTAIFLHSFLNPGDAGYIAGKGSKVFG
jgi:hypothetical protein